MILQKPLSFQLFVFHWFCKNHRFLSLLSFHQFCEIIIFCRFSRFWLFQCNFQTQAGTFNLSL
jgi:hypothetical protein